MHCAGISLQMWQKFEFSGLAIRLLISMRVFSNSLTDLTVFTYCICTINVTPCVNLNSEEFIELNTLYS